MENKKHIVYQSLIQKPKIAGLSQDLFMILIGSVMVVLIMFGMGWIGLVASILTGIYLRNLLMKAEKEDEYFLTIWISKIIQGTNHYRARGKINKRGKRNHKSIPTIY